MEFSPEEINVSIEAIAHRIKWVRTKITESTPGSTPRSTLESKAQSLDGVLKKLLPLQQKESPAKDGGKAVGSPPLEKEQDNSKYQLLLVDDDEIVRQLMRTMLSDHGFENFDECEDGHDALAKIKSKAKPYDMVLCDLNMPTMSGLDVLKILRKDKKYNKMPFVMVSGMGDKSNLKEAIVSGVSDYIVKPLDADKLVEKVLKHIK